MGLKRKNDEDGGEGADPAKASKIDIDIAKASKLDPVPIDSNKRSMQGQGEGANKHSIDSDDEEDDRDAFGKFEEMKDDDIEGQEDDTVTQEGDIKITPFNLKEEQQEGRFSKDGDFVWNKADELKDAWLDDVDWVKVKEKSAEELEKEEEADEKEDEAQAQYSEVGNYKLMVELMRPGESVAKALRRLGGGQKAVSQAQRWKKKKAGAVEDPAEKENKAKMLKLTGIADEILTRSGNMEIYEETFEGIVFKIKASEEKKIGAKKTNLLDNMDEDDALDMFAENLDGDVEKKDPEEAEKKSKNDPVLDDVCWEFKWKETDSELHGPHNSQKMLAWQESGFFDAGILVRKVGTEDFRDSKRIDFELYI